MATPVRFRAFVMVPMSEVRDGELNGYRIGRYPRRPFRGLARYRPPDGFVEVTPENRDLRVSPHFRLGDFLCKQISRTSLVDRLTGGMGYYPATSAHGPFVHIDARGCRARW